MAEQIGAGKLKFKVVKLPTTGELLDEFYRQHGYIHDRDWSPSRGNPQRPSRGAPKGRS